MYEVTIREITEPMMVLKTTNFEEMTIEDLQEMNKRLIEHHNGDNIKTTEIYKQSLEELDLNKVIIAVNGIKEKQCDKQMN